MFYLRNFLKVVWQNPVSGLGFCFLTIFLTIFSGHHDLFLNRILNTYRPTPPDPYFFVLVTSNEDISSVARRLGRLPGIKSVKVESSEKINREAKSLIQNMGVEVPESIVENEYKGMKVILGPDVDQRSMDLIKEYIGRLIGVQQVTISDVKVDDVALDAKYVKLYHFFEGYGVFTISLILLIPWFAFLFFLRKNIRTNAYLIEHYQRRNNVGAKIAGIGIISLVSLTNVASLALGMPSFRELLVMMLVLALGVFVHLKKWSWNY